MSLQWIRIPPGLINGCLEQLFDMPLGNCLEQSFAIQQG
jgi:hypothetical protein